MKVAITGAAGFVGSHLVEHYLQETDYEVYAIDLPLVRMDNVKHIKSPRLHWKFVDVTDYSGISELIKSIKPTYIHHLAGMAFVPDSWKMPYRVFEVNVKGSLNIFEAVRKHSPETILQIAGSSEEYGIPEKLPITEQMIPEPCSPYGVSKLTMDRLACVYWKSYGIKIVVTRGFNHEGARRGEQYVISDFAKQVAQIEAGLQEPVITHGNLESWRDFTHVKDMVKAYSLAVKKCDYGTPYNICYGNKIKIEYVLDKLIEMSKAYILKKQDPDKLRPSDLTILQGDSTKFREKTGWKPELTFDTILDDLLEFWREIIGKYAIKGDSNDRK